ncbi:hypothetical protein StoSoilB13_19860 [Arthrobacter sp. StoSoilB13]|nr:hypothetical protein StoSoilB13_19860 [Arthrobacter sp. StoSoilB13]
MFNLVYQPSRGDVLAILGIHTGRIQKQIGDLATLVYLLLGIELEFVAISIPHTGDELSQFILAVDLLLGRRRGRGWG